MKNISVISFLFASAAFVSAQEDSALVSKAASAMDNGSATVIAVIPSDMAASMSSSISSSMSGSMSSAISSAASSMNSAKAMPSGKPGGDPKASPSSKPSSSAGGKSSPALDSGTTLQSTTYFTYSFVLALGVKAFL